MNVPKETKRYCPHCKKHQTMKISVYKPGKAREHMSAGWRRYNKKQRGYGTQSKPVFHKNAKLNKCTLPIYTCSVCKKLWHGHSMRIKKYEIQ